MQWHASRYISRSTKGIDLADLIVYNLSNWTGLAERAMPQGLPFVDDAIRCDEICTDAVRRRPKTRRRCTSFMSVHRKERDE
jgi:hypothetical protein